jgi:hypothetical protein
MRRRTHSIFWSSGWVRAVPRPPDTPPHAEPNLSEQAQGPIRSHPDTPRMQADRATLRRSIFPSRASLMPYWGAHNSDGEGSVGKT